MALRSAGSFQKQQPLSKPVLQIANECAAEMKLSSRSYESSKIKYCSASEREAYQAAVTAYSSLRVKIVEVGKNCQYIIGL